MPATSSEFIDSNVTVLIDVSENATHSETVDVDDWRMGSFLIPATMTGSTITVQGSIDGTYFEAVRGNDNAAITAITFSSNRLFVIPAEAFRYRKLRFLSNGTEAADRSISVFLKG